MNAESTHEWQSWIGREETQADRIDEAAAERWLATLDRNAPIDGSVPQGYHWCLCLPDAPTATLGADGHPARDKNQQSLLPPVPLPRRMWAASQVEFLAPLLLGQTVTRTSRVHAITEKKGETGKLVFVDIRHEMCGDGDLAVIENQKIVFRELAPSGAPVPPISTDADCFDAAKWDAHRVLIPDETLLFRFSALTFNSHRIHYDLPYAVQEEGYRGLVVHGPLTATLLLDLAQRRFGDNAISRFDFRGTSPAICGDELHLVLKGSRSAVEISAYASCGRQIMSASAMC